MAKVTNVKKLEAVKKWLTENNLEFKENHKTTAGLEMDLWVPKLMIAVHIDDEDSQRFYKKTRKWARPFFIRESETQEFVLEKMQNCAYDQILQLQKKWQKNKKAGYGREG